MRAAAEESAARIVGLVGHHGVREGAMVMVAGLIDALHHAGWADAPRVLEALQDKELAEGIAGAALPLSVSVSDFVLGRAAAGPPGSAAVLALTRRALTDETVADPDAVLRALIRLTDPAVDELLVRDDRAPRPRAWLLRALVRDRRGADGRPVIAPGVERFLREQVTRIDRRLAGYDRPQPARIERLLLEAALYADDPDLAAFALPLGIRLEDLTSVARAVLTLREHGRLEELWSRGLQKAVAGVAGDNPQHYRYNYWETFAKVGDQTTYANLVWLLRQSRSAAVLPAPEDADRWTAPNIASQHFDLDWSTVMSFAQRVGRGEQGTQAGQATSRGLDEAAAREDMPDTTRVMFEEAYPRAVYWTARPDVTALICASLSDRGLTPAARQFGLRELLRRGLLHGTLTAQDAVAYAAPAAATLALAVPVPLGLARYYSAKGANGFGPHNSRIPAEAEERYQADLRAAVAEEIGPDPARWLKVLTRVAAWEDSLAELVRAIDEGEGLPRRRGHRWPRGVDPAAVLLEMAPEGVIDGLLEAAAQAVGGGFGEGLSDGSARGPAADSAIDDAIEPALARGSISSVDGTARGPVADTGSVAIEASRSADTTPGGPIAHADPDAIEASPSADETPGKPAADASADPAAGSAPSDPEARALLGVLTRILDRGPISRRLLDHALGPHGTNAMRLAAARNPAATGGTLWRLADREPPEPNVLAAVYLHPVASRELRVAAVVRSEEAGGLHPGLVRRLVTRPAEPALLLPALESRSAEVLHTVLRHGSRGIETDRRIAAYARLAAAAGPEPVWALELERAGSLERMHEAVRASMTEHSAAPLLAAAADYQSPYPARVTEAWDAAFHPTRPDLADRVREHLDGRPERWLRLLRSGTTLYGLLAELEAEAAARGGTSPATVSPPGSPGPVSPEPGH